MNLETAKLSLDTGPTELDARPIVELSRGGLAGGVIAAGGALFAVLLFLWLNQQRLDRRQGASEFTGRTPGAMIASPPELVVPGLAAMTDRETISAPLPIRPATITYLPARTDIGASREPSPPLNSRPYGQGAIFGPTTNQATEVPTPGIEPIGDAPAVFPPTMTAGNEAPAIVHSSRATSDWTANAPEERSARRAGPAAGGKEAVVGLRSIGDPSSVIATGTMIDAVLETPLDTARGGVARAIVSRDVRSFDGKRVLVPRGSRLVGEIGGDSDAGRRVFLIWKTLLLPNGSSIAIDSPAADSSGAVGIAGRSGSIGRAIGGLLRTVVDVGATFIGARRGGIIYAPATASAGQLVGPPPAPRITVDAGAKIAVVVAKTLDFSAAANATAP